MRIIGSVIGIAVAMSAAGNASAYVRLARWSSIYDSTFPVVRVNSCPDRFSQVGFSQPWTNIRGQALAAANEWFVSGGADIRIRLFQDLPSTDTRCIQGTPNVGEVLLTADRYFSAAEIYPYECYDAYTAVHYQTVNNIKQVDYATVYTYASITCNGYEQSIQWATNADYPVPGSSQVDFRDVYTHEFGHVLGFGHPPDSDPDAPNAVMYGQSASGEFERRFLATDDQLGLVADPTYGYSSIQTSTLHRYSTDNGATWISEGEPTAALNPRGAPSVANRRDTSWPTYIVAQSRADNRQLYTYVTTGVSSSRATTHAESTHVAPGVAASSTEFVVAYVAADSARSLKWKTSADALSWSTSQDTGHSSGLPPAVAWADWKGWYVLAWADIFSGKINTLVSKDHGATFTDYFNWPDFRAGDRVGLVCQGTGQYCLLSWPNGDIAYSKARVALLRFDQFGHLYVDSTYQLDNDSYGGSLAANDNRFEFAWRDRGYSTPFATGGWPWPPTLDTVRYSLVAHAPPTIAWGWAYNEWSIWTSYGSRYDQ